MPGAIKWGTEFLINTTTKDHQTDPAITALDTGGFMVAWGDGSATGGDVSGTAVRAQLYNADGSRSDIEFLVNTSTNFEQRAPSIAAFSDGRFVVTWQDSSGAPFDASGTAVRAQLFTGPGVKTGIELQVNSAPAGDQRDPVVAVLADGRFVVAWEDASDSQGDISGTGVLARIFNPDGSNSVGPFLVNTATTNNQGDPTITPLTDGRFVVTWEDASAAAGDTFGSAVRLQVFNSNGTKSGPERVVNTTTIFDQFDPAIAALADGRFVVAWDDTSLTGGDSSQAVRAQIFNSSGSKSGVEILVNTTTPFIQADPAVATLADGRFVVAWNDSSATGGDTIIVCCPRPSLQRRRQQVGG